ncbi:MAG: hypothetical protein ACRD36_07225, partial [Candidatus Acidiferrum sp.]
AFGQSPSTDSQTLQALLSEVRQLRQELQTRSAAAERIQILFFHIQTQQAAVARASQRADDARTKLTETQTARKKVETEAKDVHDRLDQTDQTNVAANQKDLETMASYYKQRLQELSDEEQQRQAKQIEADDQLRLEQAKLDDLQSRLDEIDKALQKSSPRSD